MSKKALSQNFIDASKTSRKICLHLNLKVHDWMKEILVLEIKVENGSKTLICALALLFIMIKKIPHGNIQKSPFFLDTQVSLAPTPVSP